MYQLGIDCQAGEPFVLVCPAESRVLILTAWARSRTDSKMACEPTQSLAGSLPAEQAAAKGSQGQTESHCSDETS